jgi:hypothetical protein
MTPDEEKAIRDRLGSWITSPIVGSEYRAMIRALFVALDEARAERDQMRETLTTIATLPVGRDTVIAIERRPQRAREDDVLGRTT